MVSESVQRLPSLKLVYRDPENQWFLKINFTFWGVLAEFSEAFAVRFRECKEGGDFTGVKVGSNRSKISHTCMHLVDDIVWLKEASFGKTTSR